MSESVVIVSNPLAVTINDGSPTRVTVVDNNSGKITIIDGTPRVAVKTNQPTEIIIHSGIGGRYDFDTIEGMLFNKITSDFLNPTLNTDINNIRNLWTRIGAEIVLLQADGEAISAVNQGYTDGKFTQALLEAAVDAEGRLELRASSIEQDINSIANTVLDITRSDDGALVILQSNINQTAEDIISTVLRIDAIDDPVTGVLAAHLTSIQQSAAEIELRLKTTDLDTHQVIVDMGTNMSAIEGNISSWVTQFGILDGSFQSARSELTATTAKTEIAEGSVNQHEWRITAAETMLSSKWGVTIAETTGGIKYVTGVGLFLHPDWQSGQSYVTGNYVFFFDGSTASVYIALQNHVSSSANSPLSGLGTHWSVSAGSKSSFIIQADELKVISPNNTVTPLLTLNGNALTLGPAIALRSANYGHTTEPWFNFNPATGQAELRNMTMTFSGSGKTVVQTALNVADGATVNQPDVTTNTAISEAAKTATNWSHASNVTTIDGGKIYTGSIAADKINVTNLSVVSTYTGALTVDSSITVGNGASLTYICSNGKWWEDNVGGFWLSNEPSCTLFEVGNANSKIYFNSAEGVFHVVGDIIATGNIVADGVSTLRVSTSGYKTVGQTPIIICGVYTIQIPACSTGVILTINAQTGAAPVDTEVYFFITNIAGAVIGGSNMGITRGKTSMFSYVIPYFPGPSWEDFNLQFYCSNDTVSVGSASLTVVVAKR
jgi:hypothetical protein